MHYLLILMTNSNFASDFDYKITQNEYKSYNNHI